MTTTGATTGLRFVALWRMYVNISFARFRTVEFEGVPEVLGQQANCLTFTRLILQSEQPSLDFGFPKRAMSLLRSCRTLDIEL